MAILDACTPDPEIPAPVIAVRTVIMYLDDFGSGLRFTIAVIHHHHRQAFNPYFKALSNTVRLCASIRMIYYNVPAAICLRKTLRYRLYICVKYNNNIVPDIAACIIF
ncbi:hypothetical protein D3C73_1150960 [compost metagenome]